MYRSDNSHILPAYNAQIPFFLGCVFVVSMSFPALLELPGGVPLPMLFMFLGFPFWFASARIRELGVIDKIALGGITWILICTSFLVLWSFLSAIDSDSPFRAGRSVASLTSAFAIFMLIVGTATAIRIQIYMSCAIVALALTSVIVVIAYFTPLYSLVFSADRAFAFFKNPNQYGIAISTVIPICISHIFSRSARRAFWIACLIVLYMGLMMSGSKMNILLSSLTPGAMLIFLIFVLYSGQRRTRMLILAMLGYVVLLLIGFALLNIFNPRAVDILGRLVSSDESVQSLQSRSELWEYSIRQFMEKPFLGQGAGQSLDMLEEGRVVAHSHNIFIDYARTLGLPGLFAFLIILLTAITLCVKSMRLAFVSQAAQPHVRVSTFALAVSSMTYLAANVLSDSMGPSTSSFFWISLFLCLAGRKYHNI